MQFPVYFHLFGMRIHPHPVMEGIAYAAGAIVLIALATFLLLFGVCSANIKF